MSRASCAVSRAASSSAPWIARKCATVDAFLEPQAHHQHLLAALVTREGRALARRVAVLFDPREPGLGGAVLARRGLGTGDGEASVRTGTHADVIAVAPIGEIVARLLSRRGVVRDLVGRQAGRVHHLLGRLVKGCRGVIRGHGEIAARVRLGERSLRLDGELVEREMCAGIVKRARKLVTPGAERLPGPRIDEIEARAREMPGGEGDRGKRFGSCMAAAEEGKRSVVERLHAEGNAIDPGRGVGREAGSLDRGRVGLERDLAVGGDGPERAHALDDRGHGLAGHERWRAAAEEDTRHHARFRVGCVVGELGQECRAPTLLLDACAHMAVKVAIGAFGEAEGPMHINAEAGSRGSTAVPLNGGTRRVRAPTHGAKQAAMSLRKASARWLIACLAAGSISP